MSARQGPAQSCLFALVKFFFNQTSITLVVLRRSVQQVVDPSPKLTVRNIAPMKRCSGGEPLATLRLI